MSLSLMAFLRSIPDVEDLLLPLKTAIRQLLISAFTGRVPCSDMEREFLGLPVRLGHKFPTYFL